MPLWNVDVEKKLGEEYWTNRYVVEEATIQAAVPLAEQITAWERAVHATGVTFTKWRVSDRVPNTDVFITLALNQPGLWNPGAVEFLPLFNVVRVDFSTGVGRPSRKYLRCPIPEGQQQDGTLIPSMITFVNNSYATPLATAAWYVDVDGEAIIQGQTWPFVGMRQLRRGSKRRLQPVIP